ncbi:hypothetical protein WDU94_009208 [Cyamophila willieti]
MASMHLCVLVVVLGTVCSSFSQRPLHRVRRGITLVDGDKKVFYPTLPHEYGTPSVDQKAVDQETHLQELNYNLLNRIHSELNEVERQISHLIEQYNNIYQNNVAIKSTVLPKEYGPPQHESLFNAKFIKDNTETIQSSINNLKSIAQHLENELNKHVQRPHSRLTTVADKVLSIDPSQHYHINAAGVLPEFLTLDPFVAYGPAPNVAFAPPAPGATSGNTALETDVYSPPDGVLLAPPAPGQYPIRTRIARSVRR